MDNAGDFVIFCVRMPLGTIQVVQQLTADFRITVVVRTES